jgi:hypothetical protein
VAVFAVILLVAVIVVAIGTVTTRRPPRRRNRANYWSVGTGTFRGRNHAEDEPGGDDRGGGTD